MANPSKRKGTAFEVLVRDYLAEHTGLDVRRMPPAGSKDVGDLKLVDGDGDLWVLECKATQALYVAGAVDEAHTEARNAGTCWGAAVIKRRNRNVAEAYVVVPLTTFVGLVKP